MIKVAVMVAKPRASEKLSDLRLSSEEIAIPDIDDSQGTKPAPLKVNQLHSSRDHPGRKYVSTTYLLIPRAAARGRR